MVIIKSSSKAVFSYFHSNTVLCSTALYTLAFIKPCSLLFTVQSLPPSLCCCNNSFSSAGSIKFNLIWSILIHRSFKQNQLNLNKWNDPVFQLTAVLKLIKANCQFKDSPQSNYCITLRRPCLNEGHFFVLWVQGLSDLKHSDLTNVHSFSPDISWTPWFWGLVWALFSKTEAFSWLANAKSMSV